MKIDYLVPGPYETFNLGKLRNSGGGMMPNIDARRRALESMYEVNVTSDLMKLTSDFCLIESLWFVPEWLPDLEEAEVRSRFASRVDDLMELPSKKLLTCTEMNILRVPWWLRAKFMHYFTGIVVNTRYLWNLCRGVGVTPIGYLSDAIDPYLFRPGEKSMSVIACGGLKHIKNPYTLFEVFERLEGKVDRIYIGNAAIWSHEKLEEDAVLEKQVRACTDRWIENASYIRTAYECAHAAICINDTWHDVSSRTNQEMLMSGVVSVGGVHPLFRERIGVHGLKSVDEFVTAIESLTDGFTKLPVSASKKSREFALRSFSDQVFLNQFNEIVRSVYL